MHQSQKTSKCSAWNGRRVQARKGAVVGSSAPTQNIVKEGDRTSYATQDVLSWYTWQRMHAVVPQWRQDVLRAEGITAMQWQRWENWQQDDARWQVQLIDTTSLSINGMVERVAGWVLMKKYLQTQSQLSLQGNWWEKRL
jgi:hypothetical protein